jgi:hypothetical protein
MRVAMADNPPEDNKLFLTALPNGTNATNGKLRVTVIVTPSLAENASLAAPFDKWPLIAESLVWSIKFHRDSDGKVFNVDPTTSPSNMSTDDRLKLWQAIFTSELNVKQRKGGSQLHQSWLLSHDATTLHDDHQSFRLADAHKRLIANRNLDPVPQLDKWQQDNTPMNLYLHPVLQEESTVSMASLIQGRRDAKAYWERGADLAGLTDDQIAKINHRVSHAIQVLEKEENEQLLAVSLYAIYKHCAESVLLPDEDGSVDSHVRAIVTQATGAGGVSIVDLEKAQRYIEFHLFYRRSSSGNSCPPDPDPPDFHQLLSLVNQFPALLRPLGLAFDLEFIAPSETAGIPIAGTFVLSASCRTIPGVSVQPLSTSCTIGPEKDDFYANPKPLAGPSDVSLLWKRYLALNVTDPDSRSNKLFNLIGEDTDGSSQKLSQQVTAASRAVEYSSKAPTSANLRTTISADPPAENAQVTTPTTTAQPLTAVPAARTVGLSLHQRNRTKNLQDALKRNPPPEKGKAPSPPSLLFAEDLILGYRVDVQYKSKWYALCARNSCYEIGDPVTPAFKCWEPGSEMESLADEGFVSFAATQSTTGTPDGGQQIQRQVHQSIFTWTGWSLAVPPPNFPRFNGPTKDCACPPGKQFVAIRPKYTLSSKLPPLRFNEGYAFRCRVVDLAGNSASADYSKDDAPVIKPREIFSRHEPIRSPQILLVKPIDRVRRPGEQVDRMVVRDGHSHENRMLVSPRESLRMAELHGILQDSALPPSAFPTQQLMADGSFPSVLYARKQGWIPDDTATKAVKKDDETKKKEADDGDAIFMAKYDDDYPICPFYPDPLARYIRVVPYQLEDDPSLSKVVSKPVYLSLYPKHSWPLISPARIRLQASSDGDTPTLKLESGSVEWCPFDENISSLTVKVPKACTVILQLTSAYCDESHRDTKGIVKGVQPSPEIHLFNFHTSFFATSKRFQENQPNTHFRQAISLKAAIADNQLKQLVEVASVLKPVENIAVGHFVDGSLHPVTPPRFLTLVHAVRRPLKQPDFAHSPELERATQGDFMVQRSATVPQGDAGATVAQATIHGCIDAHWLSTGKITCYAEWTDQIDDLKQPRPGPVKTSEVAFELANDGHLPGCSHNQGDKGPFRSIDGQIHHFRDTRAHKVTYSLAASTRFRQYYPEKEKPESFLTQGLTTRTVTVASSVRPPAPRLSYVVPAFQWRDSYDAAQKVWYRGRIIVLRAYLERPFLVSGDNEGLGIVLAHSYSAANAPKPTDQPFATRWGADPIWKISSPISNAELTAKDLQPDGGSELPVCILAESSETDVEAGRGLADIKTYGVQYAPERQLWFCDIPISTSRSYAPFIRMALVRWQPDSLFDLRKGIETRISQAVFSDFMQIGADRWVSIERKDNSNFKVSVSGVFNSSDASSDLGKPDEVPTFTMTLQSRWHALGKDMGWRPVKYVPNFKPTPDSGKDPVKTWSADLKLDHSSAFYKYRVLLEEHEWFRADGAKTSDRKPYAHFIEL